MDKICNIPVGSLKGEENSTEQEQVYWQKISVQLVLWKQNMPVGP